ncbi:MAG: hypothetical protein IJF71_06520 [Clostridia bacterium]|nr:hypothetical protein [Clostridia bacterium]
MKKIYLAIFSLVLAITAVCGSVATADGVANPAKDDNYYNYVQKFDDVNAINNAFHAYYLKNELQGTGVLEKVGTDPNAQDTHWYIKDNTAIRINNVEYSNLMGDAYETNRIAMLTYVRDAYLNFELSVDYKRGSAGFWPVIAFRQEGEGKYYLDDGAGVFVQQNGKITLWGDPDVSGPYETHMINNYKDQTWHNMQVIVLGNSVQISIDYSEWYTYPLNESFYNAGYVSLVSVNNQTEFRNFRIKALAEPEDEALGTYMPKPEADSEDSLSNLAGAVKPAEDLFERTPSENGSDKPAAGGCGSAVMGSVSLLLGALGVGFVFAKRRG